MQELFLQLCRPSWAWNSPFSVQEVFLHWLGSHSEEQFLHSWGSFWTNECMCRNSSYTIVGHILNVHLYVQEFLHCTIMGLILIHVFVPPIHQCGSFYTNIGMHRKCSYNGGGSFWANSYICTCRRSYCTSRGQIEPTIVHAWSVPTLVGIISLVRLCWKYPTQTGIDKKGIDNKGIGGILTVIIYSKSFSLRLLQCITPFPFLKFSINGLQFFPCSLRNVCPLWFSSKLYRSMLSSEIVVWGRFDCRKLRSHVAFLELLSCSIHAISTSGVSASGILTTVPIWGTLPTHSRWLTATRLPGFKSLVMSALCRTAVLPRRFLMYIWRNCADMHEQRKSQKHNTLLVSIDMMGRYICGGGGFHVQAHSTCRDPSCVRPISADGVGSLPTHLSAEEVHMSKHTQTLHVYPHFHRMV